MRVCVYLRCRSGVMCVCAPPHPSATGKRCVLERVPLVLEQMKIVGHDFTRQRYTTMTTAQSWTDPSGVTPPKRFDNASREHLFFLVIAYILATIRMNGYTQYSKLQNLGMRPKRVTRMLLQEVWSLRGFAVHILASQQFSTQQHRIRQF